MLRKVAFVVSLTALLALALVPAIAQDDMGTVAEGLNRPRSLFFDAHGDLIIGEAGAGGEEVVETDFGPQNWGPTARVLSVPAAGGEPAVVVDGLVSATGFNDVIGVQSVARAEDGSWWVVLGLAPEGVEGRHTGVLILDTDGNETGFIDFAALEAELNPDGDDVMSNPTDIALAPDGTVYVVDASGNAIYTASADGTAELFHAWEDLPVPTSVAVGPEGDIYVGFLSPFPFEPSTARIEHWSPEGELVETFDGLSYITDVAVGADGNLYAVQQSGGFGDTGWLPDSGSVIMVSADGATPVAEGINFPYALAQDPDGHWVVTVNSAFSDAGTGMVIHVEPGMSMGGGDTTAEPMATEEGAGDDTAADPAETPESSG